MPKLESDVPACKVGQSTERIRVIFEHLVQRISQTDIDGNKIKRRKLASSSVSRLHVRVFVMLFKQEV